MKTIKPINLLKVTDPQLMILINALSCGRFRPSAPAHKRVTAGCISNAKEYNLENLTHINNLSQDKSHFSRKKRQLGFSRCSSGPVLRGVSRRHPYLPVYVEPCKSLSQVVEDVKKFTR
jgi:hypothetical protein